MERKKEREEVFSSFDLLFFLDSPSLRKLNIRRSSEWPVRFTILADERVNLEAVSKRNGVVAKQTEEEFPRERNKKPQNCQ